MFNNKLIVPLALTFVVAGVGGFYGGIKYDQHRTVDAMRATVANFGNRFQGGEGGGMMGGGQRGGRGAMMGGLVSGTILAKDEKSITVELRGGMMGGQTGQSGSKIVLLSGDTQVMKSVQGSSVDLSTGEQVTVIGTANQDGSITAQSVQIRPPMPEGRASSTEVQAQ